MIQLLSISPILFVVAFVGLVLAVTIHEFAHAFAADKLGDPTPRLQGRLTLNPLAHLDPLGTLLIVLIGFGWGRPVQFDPYNLKNPRKDAALISLAGPLSNIIIATVLSLLLKVTNIPFSPLSFLSLVIEYFIRFNVTLAIFNLVPVYPLDGEKIVTGLLAKKEAYVYERFMHQYGMFILLFMIFPLLGGSSLITIIIQPIINVVMNLFLPGGSIV